MSVIKTVEDGRSAIASAAHMALTKAMEICGRAGLALSGGSTPKQYLPDVFSLELDWHKVDLILADERWVPPTDSRSNEKLIEDLRRDTPAQNANLISLWSFGTDPQEAAHASRKMAHGQKLNIDLALLGMGEDGHIASLFPGDQALNSTESYWIAVDAPAPPNVPLPRLSLSPKTLLGSKELILVFSGRRKYELWEQASSGRAALHEYPVSLLNRHPSMEAICIESQAN